MQTPFEYHNPDLSTHVDWRRIYVGIGVAAAAAVVIAVGGAAILLTLFSTSSPPLAVFVIKNRTGQPMTDFALACDGTTRRTGALAVDGTASVALPTLYHVKYVYTVTLADGHTFTGTTADWNDEDARGLSPSLDVDIEFTADGMRADAW